MKIFGAACLFAVAVLLPTNASASGSIVVLKASETFRSIVHMGEPAKCTGEACGAQTAENAEADGDVVSVDSIALAAMPVVTLDSVIQAAFAAEPNVPPVALDEKTASISVDEGKPAPVVPVSDDTTVIKNLFDLEDLRPGNQDMTP